MKSLFLLAAGAIAGSGLERLRRLLTDPLGSPPPRALPGSPPPAPRRPVRDSPQA